MSKRFLRFLFFLIFPLLVLGLLPLLFFFPLIMPPLIVLFPGLLLILLGVVTGFKNEKRDS